jgi:hypothetical protein
MVVFFSGRSQLPGTLLVLELKTNGVVFGDSQEIQKVLTVVSNLECGSGKTNSHVFSGLPQFDTTGTDLHLVVVKEEFDRSGLIVSQ